MFENHRKSLIHEACGQTVLPDRSVLVGQKLVGKSQNSYVTF